MVIVKLIGKKREHLAPLDNYRNPFYPCCLFLGSLALLERPWLRDYRERRASSPCYPWLLLCRPSTLDPYCRRSIFHVPRNRVNVYPRSRGLCSCACIRRSNRLACACRTADAKSDDIDRPEAEIHDSLGTEVGRRPSTWKCPSPFCCVVAGHHGTTMLSSCCLLTHASLNMTVAIFHVK